MLKTLRKKGVAKKILWVVAIVIIISFGFFGTANYLRRTHGFSYAGKVFNRTISFDEFDRNLMHARNQAMLLYGENFYKLKQLVNLESDAWDRIILLHEARRQRIRVTDQEVIKAVENFDLFKKNGSFDARNYDQIVRYYFKCDPRDFEETIRDLLTFAKLKDKIASAVRVADEDIRKAYQEKNEKAQVSYVLFSTQTYQKDVAVDHQEIEQYYAQHKEELRQPPSIKILYLQAELSPDANEEQKTAVAQKIEKITGDLKATPDLEKIGQKYGLAVKESDFFSREKPLDSKLNLPYEVLLKAFELEGEQVSDPVTTSKGYYILKLKQKRDAYIPDLKEASDSIKQTLVYGKAKDIAKAKAADSLKQIKEQAAGNPQKSFADIVGALGLKAQQTPLFDRSQPYLPGIGPAKEFLNAAFALNDKNKISDVIDVPVGYGIIHLDSFLPVDEEKFKNEKENFGKLVLEEKKNQMFSDFLQDLRIKANLQDNISKIKKQAGRI